MTMPIISDEFKQWFEREWSSYQDKAISGGKVVSMAWALKGYRAAQAQSGVIAAAQALIAADRAQALTTEHVNALENAIAIQRGEVALPAPAQSGEPVACIAPVCHQWDGTDTCTCERQRAIDTLKRVATALPVLKAMLAKEGLGGVDVAEEMLADVQTILAAPQPSQPMEAGEPPMDDYAERLELSKALCRIANNTGMAVWQIAAIERAAKMLSALPHSPSAVVLDDERAAFGECIRLLESCLLNFNWPELRVAMESAIKSAREALASHDARAASPQATVCATCNGHSMIGGPSYYAPDEGGEPCPDCTVALDDGQRNCLDVVIKDLATAHSLDRTAASGWIFENHNLFKFVYAARAASPQPVAQTERALTGEARDAARYRWLRHADLDALAAANWGRGGEVYEGEKFDAAIDAALSTAQSTGEPK